jgi:hypothetical protein
MNNEQFLIASYFGIGALVMGLGLGVYACLRRPLQGIALTFRSGHLGMILRRLLPVGLVLPALAGFLSVDYESCGMNYAKAVSDRSYLMAKNQEQIAAACFYLAVALVVWEVIVLLTLATQAKKPARTDEL